MLIKFGAVLAMWLVLASGGVAQTQVENGKRLGAVIAAIEADDWIEAGRLTRSAPEDVTKTYFEWRRLRAGLGGWSEYKRFLTEHSDWPGLPFLRKAGELKIPPGLPAADILAYFENPPETAAGMLHYVDAMREKNGDAAANAALVEAWTTVIITPEEQTTILSRHGKRLAAHNWARTDAMIWDGQLTQASRMLPLLSEERQALVRARVALRRNSGGVNALIDLVPEALTNDPGLRFDRFYWRMRRDIYDGAEEMVLQSSASRETLGNPSVWSRRRAILARKAMRERRFETAYDIARHHHMTPDERGFRDLEWLSGYIALRYLNRPTDAVTHFRRIRQLAVTPITSGRVWFWLGKAHQAAGNEADAREAFRVGGRYLTSIYGQLAAAEIGITGDASLAGAKKLEWVGAPFLQSTVFRAGLLLHYAGERYEGGRFFAHLAESMDTDEQTKLGQLLVELDRPNMALRVAKNAARLGRMIMPAYYPIDPRMVGIKDAPLELALAVARQETEFNPDVSSGAGARGLMQLMPATAKAMAKKVGLDYSRARLTSDPAYNVKLGASYLAQLLARYDGSYVLTAAAYNAGPSRVRRWIEENGDPRSKKVDVIDWIEAIPFSETRNYVQRVVESTGVYRVRLTGDPAQLDIVGDLNRGQNGLATPPLRPVRTVSE